MHFWCKIGFFILAAIVFRFGAPGVCAHNLVDIKAFNPKIHVDLRYSTEDNYLVKAIYPCNRVFVDLWVAKRLSRVQRDLAKDGLGLIIWEGYRPPSIQKLIEANTCSCALWMCQRDSDHYRKGLGVDVAIYYLDGQPLELPTPYDDISASAYRGYPFLPSHVFHNCALLEKYMVLYGFVPMREKWWHYDFKGWDDAPCLDLEYDELCSTPACVVE